MYLNQISPQINFYVGIPPMSINYYYYKLYMVQNNPIAYVNFNR